MLLANELKNITFINGKDFRFLWFAELIGRSVCSPLHKLGKLTDLVFKTSEPYAEAVGIYIEHGWGKPTEFVPWDRVIEITQDVILVHPPDDGTDYPAFVDQPGWILVDEHLIGKTVLDTDGRRVEVVNDVHLLESKGRLIIVHVDASLNGFLRKWGMGSLRWVNDKLIPWRYVQPFSLEDAIKTDTVSLSIKKEQAADLPGEDLADVLEMLSGEEQEAFFSVLDVEKAAESLICAEPRVRRQLIEDLSKERAETILAELSIPQLADIFSDLPHDDVTELMQFLSQDKAERLHQILYEHEAEAKDLMSSDFLTFSEETAVGEALQAIRKSALDKEAVTYIYVVNEERLLEGVVDIRKLILAPDQTRLTDIMSSAVVTAEEDKMPKDLEEMFDKYRYRMIPVVDKQDRLIGVIHYNDVMQASDQ